MGLIANFFDTAKTFLRLGGRPTYAVEGYEVQRRPYQEEKIRSNLKIPWFLPYYDNEQNLEETPVMRLVYRRMLADPNVKSAVLGKLMGVMSLELKVHPADKKNQRDKEIAEFVQWNLNQRLAGGLPGLAWSLLIGAILDGYAVCEKVWDIQAKGKWKNKRVLRFLKPKDTNQDLVLEVDEFRNITGVKGLRYNAGEVYHPDDFLIYSHLGLFGNPAGMSDLRAAYRPYWLLDTVTKLRAMGAEKRALPVVTGEYPEATKQKSLEEALARIKSSNWLAVPKDTRLAVLDIAGSSNEYFASFRHDLQEDIFLAIQGATLQAMTGGAGQLRGSSLVHKDTADLFKWHLSASLTHCLNDQERGLIIDMVDGNFAGITEYPHATLGAIDDAELAESLQIDLGLKQLGWRHSAEEIAERYGRKIPADPEDVLTSLDQQQTDHQAARQRLENGKTMKKPPGKVEAGPERPQKEKYAEITDEIAGGEENGDKAEALLARYQVQGTETLTCLARSALARLLAARGLQGIMRARNFLDHEELADLARQIEGTQGSADLLGRARIRLLAQRRAGQDAGTFSVFDDQVGIPLLGPKEALAYFKKLVPSLKPEPQRTGPLLEAEAFTVALATSKTMLQKIKDIILQRLENGREFWPEPGKGIQGAPGEIDGILRAAGIHPENQAYAEMVFRTNLMEAYRTGAQREFSDPDLADSFPVWRYLGIHDGRERHGPAPKPDHLRHFGKYYGRDVPFTAVRGTDASNVINCRCDFVPVFVDDWKALQRKGKKVEVFP